ncbi:hypothetical protein PoB_004225900 [Plakobranchus ocellatus]|uniref:Uncharacterized protein n=1 Tax=Plakobranchus ocellatus TaxID=259542 RepID=A0AAV4B6N5_9GAST|nr:hypothetical protein PoB_004225900 [Plakobranchus ocellatus]
MEPARPSSQKPHVGSPNTQNAESVSPKSVWSCPQSQHWSQCCGSIKVLTLPVNRSLARDSVIILKCGKKEGALVFTVQGCSGGGGEEEWGFGGI